MLKEQSVLHGKFRAPHNQLPLQFELQHGNRLVHLHVQAQIFCVVIRIVLDGKSLTVGIFISIQRKGGKGDQIDAVAFLQRIQIAVSGRHADHVCDTGQMSACRPHPHNVVIAPLHVHRVILAECIQNDMRSRPPVENISHNVQMVDHQPLDQVAQRDDKFLRPANADDGVDDLVIICLFILHLRLLCDQFLNDIGKVFGQRLSHLGPGVFRRNPLCDLHKPVQRDLVPVLNGSLILLLRDNIQLLLRIID